MGRLGILFFIDCNCLWICIYSFAEHMVNVKNYYYGFVEAFGSLSAV